MAAVMMAAVAEVNGGIPRSGWTAERSHIGMASIDMLHGAVGALLVKGGVIGNAAVAEVVGHGMTRTRMNKL
jgi:hypothetical protein